MTEGTPITCSLGASDLRQRLAEIAEVGADSLIARSADGERHLLRFRSDADTRRRLEAIVAAEAKCCSFLDLSLEEQGGDSSSRSVRRRTGNRSPTNWQPPSPEHLRERRRAVLRTWPGPGRRGGRSRGALLLRRPGDPRGGGRGDHRQHARGSRRDRLRGFGRRRRCADSAPPAGQGVAWLLTPRGCRWRVGRSQP